jgi:probable F420-dependent oxidoreductase
VSPLRIGAKLPNSGDIALERGIPRMARALEEAGFDGLWVSDHVVMPAAMQSRYPFASDGKATWSVDTPYLDCLIALGLAAAVTERVTLGTAVLVLPLRQPLVWAKQCATLDVASAGRLRMGVGVGWLEEEFDALNVPFGDRAARLEEWIELGRQVWTGRPAEHRSERYTLPAGVRSYPTLSRPVPILLGGHSRPVLRRIGRLADGWVGQQTFGELDPAEIRDVVARIRESATAHGRDLPDLQVVLRIIQAAGRFDELAADLPALAEAGVTEVIVDVDWDADDLASQHDLLRAAVPA